MCAESQPSVFRYIIHRIGATACHLLTQSCYGGTSTATRVSLHLETRTNIWPPPKLLWLGLLCRRQERVFVQTVTGLDITGSPICLELMTATEPCALFSSRKIDTLFADSSNGNALRGQMNYRCKMCGYNQMPFPPNRHNICPCCGIEYGVDDAVESFENLRNDWLRNGAPWFSTLDPFVRPPNWNAWDQLDLAGLPYSVPRPNTAVVKNQVITQVWVGNLVIPDERVRWTH